MATAPTDLTTVEAVQAYLAIPDPLSNATMASLQQFVSSASLYITTFCAVANFNSTTYTGATFNGNGRDRLYLRNWPITAVTSVTINGQSIPASTGYGNPGFTFDDASVVIRPGFGAAMAANFNVFPGGTWAFWKGVANVEITYTAGFTTIPADLAQAAIEIAAASYIRGQNAYMKSTSAGIAGVHGSTSFGLEVPLMAQQTIRNYQRVWGSAA